MADETASTRSEYLVLLNKREKITDPTTWEIVGVMVGALSPKDAVATVMKGDVRAEGEFAVLPWEPTVFRSSLKLSRIGVLRRGAYRDEPDLQRASADGLPREVTAILHRDDPVLIHPDSALSGDAA